MANGVAMAAFLIDLSELPVRNQPNSGVQLSLNQRQVSKDPAELFNVRYRAEVSLDRRKGAGT